MHYVILRDDDTNALTPPACLERLYRPFLSRGLPVNLAVIPEVRRATTDPLGRRESFVPPGPGEPTVPLAQGQELVAYLRANPGYHLVQHGCHHDCFEFALVDRREIERRLERGADRFVEAGFASPKVFVAPHDRFSPESLRVAGQRFAVVSSGWFELRRLPPEWWPRYAVKKALRRPHWRAGRTVLLSHPGCILSCHRRSEDMLAKLQGAVLAQRMTVLVTHWWEYFNDGLENEPFVRVLHELADWLASRTDVRVVPFTAVAEEQLPLT
jgi:predicted deacetylase